MSRLHPSDMQELVSLLRRLTELEHGRLRIDPETQTAHTPPAAPTHLGKPVADVAKGASGDVEIWAGDKGAEIATGEILPEVFCRTQSVTAADLVYVFDVGGLEMNKAEC